MQENTKSEKAKQLERWFIRHGLPHLIHDYGVHGDVLARAVPALAVIYFVEVFLSMGEAFSGWTQAWVFMLFLVVSFFAGVLLNVIKRRKAFSLPEKIGFLEVLFFVFVPSLLSMISTTGSVLEGFLAVALGNLVLLGVVYVSTRYGIHTMFYWSIRFMVVQIKPLAQLMARSLPLLMLFATFIFLNAEVWQVAYDMNNFYAIIVFVIVMIGLLFMYLHVPSEVDSINDFEDHKAIKSISQESNAPTDDMHHLELPKDPIPLSGKAAANLRLLLFVSHTIRFLFAGFVIGSFYTFFGLLAVRRDTIEQWTEVAQDGNYLNPIASFDMFGSEVVVTKEHFIVAGFIAAFAALQFAVSSIVESAYKAKYHEDFQNELKRVLAVRTLYLAHMNEGYDEKLTGEPQ